MISAQTFQRIHPSEFHRKFLIEGVRPDGRTLDTFRKTRVQNGVLENTNGSSLVRIGNTSIMCGIKAEVALPSVNSPKNGYIG